MDVRHLIESMRKKVAEEVEKKTQDRAKRLLEVNASYNNLAIQIKEELRSVLKDYVDDRKKYTITAFSNALSTASAPQFYQDVLQDGKKFTSGEQDKYNDFHRLAWEVENIKDYNSAGAVWKYIEDFGRKLEDSRGHRGLKPTLNKMSNLMQVKLFTPYKETRGEFKSDDDTIEEMKRVVSDESVYDVLMGEKFKIAVGHYEDLMNKQNHFNNFSVLKKPEEKDFQHLNPTLEEIAVHESMEASYNSKHRPLPTAYDYFKEAEDNWYKKTNEKNYVKLQCTTARKSYWSSREQLSDNEKSIFDQYITAKSFAERMEILMNQGDASKKLKSFSEGISRRFSLPSFDFSEIKIQEKPKPQQAEPSAPLSDMTAPNAPPLESPVMSQREKDMIEEKKRVAAQYGDKVKEMLREQKNQQQIEGDGEEYFPDPIVSLQQAVEKQKQKEKKVEKVEGEKIQLEGEERKDEKQEGQKEQELEPGIQEKPQIEGEGEQPREAEDQQVEGVQREERKKEAVAEPGMPAQQEIKSNEKKDEKEKVVDVSLGSSAILFPPAKVSKSNEDDYAKMRQEHIKKQKEKLKKKGEDVNLSEKEDQKKLVKGSNP